MGHIVSATATVAFAHGQHGAPGTEGLSPTWQQDAAVLLLACAAALFVVAGVIRLARWRLVGDPHSALVGSALVVMGGLYLPLEGIAAVGGALQHRDLAEALIRGLVSVIAAGLVLRSLHVTSVGGWDRPGRLLPVLTTAVLLAFGALVAVEASMAGPLAAGPTAARLLSGAMVIGWLALAVAVRRRTAGLSWSRRAAPLFAGFALAEGCYGLSAGTPAGTAAGLVMCTGVAALCVWSSHLDLAAALLQTERAFGSLSHTLRDIRREAVELSEWRANLVHDADNAVAGLRAALDVLGEREEHASGPAAQLCRAASDEILHLDHLLHRSPHEPVRPFDAAALVRRVGRSAQVLGADVTVHADVAPAIGRPGDVVAVLKNLLANACRHAPGATVALSVERRGDRVLIGCADDGPGLDEATARHAFDRGFRGPGSAGSGLGLHEARLLMRAQGGDLVLEPQRPGARFVATLPVAVEAARVIPTQRSGPPAVVADRPAAAWS